MPNHEQHMLNNTSSYSELLNKVDFGCSKVLEIGCGTGVLTSLLIDKVGYDRVTGIEIDASIVPGTLKNNVLIGDFMELNLDFLWNENYLLIANPPYSLLPDIKERLIDSQMVSGFILMTSERLRQALFPDSEIAFTLAGDQFVPPANGNHPVIHKNISFKRQ